MILNALTNKLNELLVHIAWGQEMEEKLSQMNLFARQEYRCRLRGQIVGHGGREEKAGQIGRLEMTFIHDQV